MNRNKNEAPQEASSGLGRRRFLQTAGALGTGIFFGNHADARAGDAQTNPTGSAPDSSEAFPPPLPMTNTGPGQIPQRALGKTGVNVSILGMGGHHLGDPKSVDDAITLVHQGIDAGINFFDNCWEYHNGKSEDWLGRALKGQRDKVFLMTKVCTHGRGGKLGLMMLEESLRRLQTDHLDLWQVHGVSFDNDPELAYAKGGILEAFDQAKQQGKVRFVGFTGHKDPGIHLKMIQMGYAFDTVQMPLNPFDASFFSFQRQVIPEALQRGIAVLGMKSMCGGGDPIKKGVVTAEEMLRFAMSLPVTTTISGIDKPEVLRQNLAVARDFKPLSAQAMQSIRDRCAPFAADGRFELYKVSIKYDNPEAREPHGFPDDPTQKEIKDLFEKPVANPGPDQMHAESLEGNTP